MESRRSCSAPSPASHSRCSPPVPSAGFSTASGPSISASPPAPPSSCSSPAASPACCLPSAPRTSILSRPSAPNRAAAPIPQTLCNRHIAESLSSPAESGNEVVWRNCRGCVKMLFTLIAIGVVVLGIAYWIKREIDRRELEQYSVTPEVLHSMLASNPGVLLFDVRLPLDLLVDSEIIPGARRIPPQEVIKSPS